MAKNPYQLKADKAADASAYTISVDNEKKALVINSGDRYLNLTGSNVVTNNKKMTYWKLELVGTAEGSLTNIVEIETEANTTVIKGIFDLTGRKIDEITEPGIYIINGKKTLVK